MASGTCGNCGAPARPPFLAPPAETSPDLDGRPGEPARSTLSRWVQVCPSCRAAAPDLSRLRPGPVPDEADPFRRWALAAEQLGEGADGWLWAAWAADDAGNPEAAAVARRRASGCWPDGTDPLRRADVLRRAGAFADAAAVLDAVAAVDEETASVLGFLRARVAAGDAGRHLLSSALRPPARRPHVSHAAPRRPGLWAPGLWVPGLWARLTGRGR